MLKAEVSHTVSGTKTKDVVLMIQKGSDRMITSKDFIRPNLMRDAKKAWTSSKVCRVWKNALNQLADAVEKHSKQQVMDGLYEQNKVDLPSALVADEINALRQQSLSQFGAAADSFDASLLPDSLFEEQAQRRVALGVILNKAVEHFEIKPDRDQVMAYIDEIAASYDDPEQVKNQFLGDENRLQQVQLMVVEKTVVEKITEVAQVTEKACSYEDALQGPQAQEA